MISQLEVYCQTDLLCQSVLFCHSDDSGILMASLPALHMPCGDELCCATLPYVISEQAV